MGQNARRLIDAGYSMALSIGKWKKVLSTEAANDHAANVAEKSDTASSLTA